jgi:HEAT repeat protein
MSRLRILMLLTSLLVLTAGALGQVETKPVPKDEGPPQKADEKKKEAPPQAPADPGAADEQTLKDAHVDFSGPGLIEFLRKRLPTVVSHDQATALLQQLADKTPAVHDKAAGEFAKLGTAALPFLQQASKELDDTELAVRAQQCINAINNRNLPVAVVRLLALRKPPGAVEALLEYLPFADDQHVADEIVAALTEVGLPGGVPHPALVKALQDPIPVRRATVAEILCRNGGPNLRPAVRQLMHDPKAHVRMRTALALAESQEADAIPVLIDLLSDMEAGQRKPVEDFLSQLAGEWTLAVPAGPDGVSKQLRRKLWLEWWQTMDGPALVDEFRKRSVPDAEREKASKLIAQLGEDIPAVRDKAQANLLAMSKAAIPSLRKALHTAEGKGIDRIRYCLTQLERDAPGPLSTAAARLIGLRKPPGAAEALLAYLPCADDEMMAGEVQEALVRVAVRDGKVDPALLQALDDKLPQRRALAAEVICQTADAVQRAPVEKLLTDADLSVRMRAAFAIAGAMEKKAIPHLIALLDQLPQDQWGEVEDYLRRVAGDSAPKTESGDDKDARRKIREQWTAWWMANSDKVELARNESKQRLLGYTLLVEAWSRTGRGGRVLEVDAAGKKRWEITGLQYPMDARVVGHDRVLIAEYQSSMVTERDFKGSIVWQKSIELPVGAQRLPNGNTVITTRNRVVEVDREGKENVLFTNMNHEICVAQKLRNGQLQVIFSTGRYVRLDSKGKELKSVPISIIHNFGAGVDFPGRDHVLMPLMQQNKVVEHNESGKVVWEASVNMPCSAVRLPNGNTLVACQNAGRCVELNRSGKVVWEYKDNVTPHYASRR